MAPQLFHALPIYLAISRKELTMKPRTIYRAGVIYLDALTIAVPVRFDPASIGGRRSIHDGVYEPSVSSALSSRPSGGM